MLNHTHIISRLSREQKIRLLTDIHSTGTPEVEALGIPRLRCGSAQETGGDAYPSPVELARSWNTALLADISDDQCRRAAAEGVRHLLLPPAKVRLTPFGECLAEDPCLAGALAGAFAEGARRTGMSCGPVGYGFTEAELALADRAPDARFLYTFLQEPYRRVAGGAPPTATVTEAGEGIPLGGGLGLTLCRRTDGRGTVRAIADGQICLEGNAAGLFEALQNHDRIKLAMEHGRATTGELQAACARGDAISEETLDAALERLFGFADACTPPEAVAPADPVKRAMLQYRAALASTVLLENRVCSGKGRTALRALPLIQPTTVCLIGDGTWGTDGALRDFTAELTARGHTVTGHAQGYGTDGVRRDGLTAEAVALAARSDTVLVFLDAEPQGERRGDSARTPALRAVQRALCDRLSRLDKRVILIISSRMTLDLSFVSDAVHPFSAVLLAPLHSACGLQALAEILTGKRSPEGRLPVTLCAPGRDGPHIHDRRQVGPFVGYRYYATLGYGALYPFGHGLSYTSFSYTDLKTEGGSIRFTVTNTGSRPGTEIAQVYLGKKDSAVLRPALELAHFFSVTLEPGESRTLSMPIPAAALPVCRDSGEPAVEAGVYTLAVGASVSDIRLRTELTLEGEALPSDGEDPADYLPMLTNIPQKRYVMEAEYTPMKSSLRNLIFGIAALGLAVSLKIYDVVTAADGVFPDIVALILALGAASFFAMEVLDKRKQRAAERAELEAANAELFADAASIPVPSAEELFADELYVPADEPDAPSEEEADSDYDPFCDVDKSMTFADAVKGLMGLGEERGVLLSESTARSILASLAASRLAVVRGMEPGRFAALTALLGQYFSTPAAVDTVDGSYRSEADVLFAEDANQARSPRHALEALESARRERGRIHIAALSGVEVGNLSEYLVPFVRHAHAPRSGVTVTAGNAEGETVAYRLPENLWMILNLKEGETLCHLPDYVTEIAAVSSWTLELTAPAERAPGVYAPFGYGQMTYLCDSLRSDLAVGEDTWKKIDRLEAYAAKYADFRMGNKLWLGLEMYLSVLLSLGVPEAAARDEALAVRLLPSLIPLLSGRIPRDDRGLCETLDALFGDDNTAICRSTVKESGADLI